MPNITDSDNPNQPSRSSQPAGKSLVPIPVPPGTPRPPLGPDTWSSHLLLDIAGRRTPCLENIALHLQYHEDWDGVLAYDEFAGRVTALRHLPDSSSWTDRRHCPFPWTDDDTTSTTRWLQRQHLEVHSTTAVRQAVQDVARRNLYHPVRQYLLNLTWDGEWRTDRWLHDYLGVQTDTPDETKYVEEVAARFLRSAIARVMEPGCQVDTCLILEGPQGKRKSSAIETLFSAPWYTSRLSNINNKDALTRLRGKWVVVFDELEALNHAGVASIKSFLTTKVDDYRVSYGRDDNYYPRQNVFAGSVNTCDWMRDETGGRRFWPVSTTNWIDTDRIAQDRDQLWAEAYYLYSLGHSRAGDPGCYWIDSDNLDNLCRDQQATRYQADVWQPAIEQRIATGAEIDIDDLFGPSCLGIARGDRNAGHKKRVVACLTALGYVYKQVRVGDWKDNSRVRKWVKR